MGSYIRNDPTIANSWVSWVALTKALHAAARFESRRIKVIFKNYPDLEHGVIISGCAIFF